MSYYRTYFSKNNTIIKNSNVNTAKNPNTEIFYGSGFSKFIFQLDLTGLQNKIYNGDFVLNSNTRHFLHLVNTIFGDEGFKGQKRGTGRQRTSSFDLTLFRISEFWDEGVGYDYEEVYDYTTGNVTFDVRPSNWENRTTLDQWNEAGIYAISGDTITKIHFDNGDENINVDITDYINSIIYGDIIDYGIGLAFDTPYMDVTNDIDQSVAFFTKYTQTFFEPYVETIFDDTIDDNRENFFIDSERNLYLYVNHMDNTYNLDESPTVNILDSNLAIIGELSGLTSTKIRKGVYKITFGLSGQICDGKRFYYDEWCNLKVDGKNLPCVRQKFIPKPFAAFFDIGTNQTELNRYAIQFFGVNLNEKIKRGTKRKIVATFKSINSTKSELLDEVYYRIYIKEGKTQVNVFDWTKMDRTNENSFMLDTTFMIPREYWIEIKANVFSENIFYKDEIKFEIISEKIIGWEIPDRTLAPTKTPSRTPSITTTPSITPTITITPSITRSITPSITITPSTTPRVVITHGLYYNGYVKQSLSGKNIAPIGWHISTLNDITTLSSFDSNGNRLMLYDTNIYGFDAFHVGRHIQVAPIGEWGFQYYGTSGYWWLEDAMDWSPSNPIIYNGVNNVRNGIPIRCVRDTNVGWVAGEKVVDYDGNIYDTCQIGTQIWLRQNLAVTHFNDGTPIAIVNDNTWASDTSPRCCAYNYDWYYVSGSFPPPPSSTPSRTPSVTPSITPS